MGGAVIPLRTDRLKAGLQVSVVLHFETLESRSWSVSKECLETW